MRARGKRGVGCERCVRAVSDLVGVVSNGLLEKSDLLAASRPQKPLHFV